MKITKRNLLKGGIFATIASFFASAPTYAKATQDSVTQKEKMDPFDAVKTVFDKMLPIKDQELNEFQITDAVHPWGAVTFHCKLLPKKYEVHHEDTWLIYYEAPLYDPKDATRILRRTREIRIVRILSKEVCAMAEGLEYNPKKDLRVFSHIRGKNILSVTDGFDGDSDIRTKRAIETGALFHSGASNELSSVSEMCIVKHFLELCV